MLDFLDGVLVHISEIVSLFPAWIIFGDRDHFVIALATVDHVHDGNRSRLNQNTRMEWVGREEYHIECIAIFPEGLRDKSVVKRIVLSALHCSVELDETTFLVDFIFVLGTFGDFDNNIDHFWEIITR